MTPSSLWTWIRRTRLERVSTHSGSSEVKLRTRRRSSRSSSAGLKTEINNADGTPHYPAREAKDITVTYPAAELQVQELLVEYTHARSAKAVAARAKANKAGFDLLGLLLRDLPERIATGFATYPVTVLANEYAIRPNRMVRPARQVVLKMAVRMCETPASALVTARGGRPTTALMITSVAPGTGRLRTASIHAPPRTEAWASAPWRRPRME
jgi:hypothetical protein